MVYLPAIEAVGPSFRVIAAGFLGAAVLDEVSGYEH